MVISYVGSIAGRQRKSRADAISLRFRRSARATAQTSSTNERNDRHIPAAWRTKQASKTAPIAGIELASHGKMHGIALATDASELVRPTFDQVYADNFRSVWSNAKRLGVPANAIDDVVQEVFVAVYRQLGTFQGCKAETWVFSILVRVVWNYRRTRRRKGAGQALASCVDDPDSIVASGEGPLDKLLQREAARLLRQLLDTLGEPRAALFVMSELEGMTAPEISSVTEANLSTVYGRLRAMRIEFARQLQRLHRTLELQV